MRLLAALAIACALASPAASDRAAALKFFRAGEKAYQAQRFEAAAHNFHEAFKALPLPEIAFSAAQAYRRQYRIDPQRRYVEYAVELYRFYLSKVKEGGRVGDAADSLGEMERELDKLGGKAAPAKVEAPTQLGVTVNLAGEVGEASMREVEDKTAAPQIAVRTFIDGKPVAPDEMIAVEPGDHVLRAEAHGFATKEQKHPAPKGHSEMVEIELQALPATVQIRTESGARISIDGRGIGTAPVGALELAAGRHVVTIARAGRVPVSRELVVERGGKIVLDQTLAPTGRRRTVKYVGGAAIGIGVLAVATGVGAWFADRDARDKLEQLERGNHPPGTALADYDDARDLRDELVTGTWVLGATAVGIGVIAGALYYFDDSSAEGIQVTPFATAGSAGASVMTRF